MKATHTPRQLPIRNRAPIGSKASVETMDTSFQDRPPKGVWFYFPAAFAIKSSLSFLILLLLGNLGDSGKEIDGVEGHPVSDHSAGILSFCRHSSGDERRLATHFADVRFSDRSNRGAAWMLIQANRRWAYAVAVLLIFQAVSTTWTFPAFMAYANELWGGPTQTYKYLTDSNVDWAQQLKATKRCLDGRGVEDRCFVYFGGGVIGFSYYGIPYTPLPTPDAVWTGNLPRRRRRLMAPY